MRAPAILVLLTVSVWVPGCQPPEEEALGRFFDAVRTGDHVTLAGMSVVGFSGPVDYWELIAIESERREPFRLPELRRRAAEAEWERDRQFQEYSRFREANRKDLGRVRARLDKDPDFQFEGRWGEIQAEWEEYRARYEDLDQRRQTILKQMDEELRLAKMSLMSAERVDRFEGEVVQRDVIIRVRTEEAGEKPYRFSLRKYDLVRREDQFNPPSRWIVTAIDEIVTE